MFDKKNLFHIAVCFSRICAPKGLLLLRGMVERLGRIEFNFVPGSVHFNPCSDHLDTKLHWNNDLKCISPARARKIVIRAKFMLGSQFSFFIRFAFFIATNLVGLYKRFKRY